MEQTATVLGAQSFSVMESDSHDASPDYSGASSQAAPPAPQRPPTNPIRGLAGTFGVAFDTYTANGPAGFSLSPLPDGSGAGTHIKFQGGSGSTNVPYDPLPQHKKEANNFIDEMEHWGWNNTLLQADDKLQIAALRGSGTPFNQVSLGVLILHCEYGTSIDFAANECKQMYYPITSGGSAQYLRMSEMNLGGAGTNGLKWMAIRACHSLYHVNWSSMQSAGIQPYNSNLHLLLGSDTDSFSTGLLLSFWATYMNYGKFTNSPMTIRAAWYQAAQDAYRASQFNYGETIKFVVAGDSACLDDTLQTNYSPTGSWAYDTPTQVWP